ncbi:MAG: hypothetical protein IKQ92_01765 [Clostridia bacterium]|nr:hypothetical protein [Clostridia bacterium]
MSLFAACLLTVLIECPFLALFGYRSRYDLTVTAAANVLTNLTLNLALRFLLPYTLHVVILGELSVTAAEYGIYAAAHRPSKRLLALTVAANLLSVSLGTGLMMLAAPLFRS